MPLSFNRPTVRVEPALPAAHMKTYQIASPAETHTRRASCAEAECTAYQGGFVLTVDESTPLGIRQAAYVRAECRPTTAQLVPGDKRRRYVEAHHGGLTQFTFGAGTECFAEHRLPLDRPALYVVRGGDWRGNPAQVPVVRHDKPWHWVEDFATHQDKLATRRQRG